MTTAQNQHNSDSLQRYSDRAPRYLTRQPRYPTGLRRCSDCHRD